MNHGNNDVRSEEQKLLERYGASVETLRAQHSGCPRIGVLRASQAGVLPEDAAQRVARHIVKCDFCRVLLRDLADEQFVIPTPGEAQRVRVRVLAAPREAGKAGSLARSSFGGWFWKAAPFTAVVAVALAAVLWVRFHSAGSRGAPLATSGPGTATMSALQWEKLPIRLQEKSALIVRGEQARYARELTRALAYYRQDNYAEAAQQLEKVTRAFPRGVEGQLYLGISRLYLQRNAEAILPLVAAQESGPEPFRDDATWYLALAFSRTGDHAHALVELERLCLGESAYVKRACAAIQELPTPSPGVPGR